MLETLLVDEDGVPIPDHDRVGLTIQSDMLEREMWVPFMSPSELTAERVMLAVDTVLQSNKDWIFNAPMHVRFVHAPLPAGGVRNKRCSARLLSFLKEKKTLIPIVDAENNTCCARAIVMAKLSRDGNQEMVQRCRRVPRRLVPLVNDLHQGAAVPQGVLCGASEWQKFQAFLGNEYDLLVVSSEYFNNIIYRGNPVGKKQLCIFHVENHFHTITNLKGFLGFAYMCVQCLQGYGKKGEHR